MQKSISVTLTAKKDQGSQNYENCLLFRQETAGNRRGRVMHSNRVFESVEKHPVIFHRFRLRENASYTCGACVDALSSGMAGKCLFPRVL